MLAVIDYDAGNLHSVTKAVQALGVQPVVTADPRVLDRADALILPGVGSAVAAMRELRARGLVEPLREAATSGRPFLGICLGLQVLLEASEEGEDGYEPCLGVLEGMVRRLPAGPKVPHMGWNSVEANRECPLFAGCCQRRISTSCTPITAMYRTAQSSPDGSSMDCASLSRCGKER